VGQVCGRGLVESSRSGSLTSYNQGVGQGCGHFMAGLEIEWLLNSLTWLVAQVSFSAAVGRRYLAPFGY
jgi:hypothetical protein